jgi:thaumarchaeosortase
MFSFFKSQERISRFLLPALPLLAFIVPLVWLYTLDQLSFEMMWKGRTFQLFFVWLIALELILGWENFKENKISKLHSARAAVLAFSMMLPTVYVWASYYLGINSAITNLALSSSLQGQWASSMPLSFEYLAFAVFFLAIVFLAFGKKGLLSYSIPAFFMLIVCAIYTIDNVYPYGQFTLFQFFVPTTASAASAVFNLMGYSTVLGQGTDQFNGTMPTLTVLGPNGSTKFASAWPCAGIESLLIYTVVVLLFLKRMPTSWKAKVGYFAFGAAVTYVINIVRIVTIFVIGMQFGAASPEVDKFHAYYGPLYSISWIIAYPLIILASKGLRQRFRTKKSIEIESKLPIGKKNGLGNVNDYS